MDQQIEELKELVRRAIAVSEDTNKLVHAMRRRERIQGIFRAVWALVVVAAAVAAYMYLAPYLSQFEGIYNSAQQAIHQAQQFSSQFNGQQPSQ